MLTVQLRKMMSTIVTKMIVGKMTYQTHTSAEDENVDIVAYFQKFGKLKALL